MPDVHSKFPPSAAERHLNCLPSLLLEAQCPNTTNDAAQEGTYAHWIAENKLLAQLGLPANTEEPEWKDWDLEAMDEHTDHYIDFINAEADFLGAKTIIPERQVYFDNWVDGGFGTSDCIVISDDTISIIDFKYGRTPVDVHDNTQLKIYALGAVQEFQILCPNLSKIRISIFQPKIDNIGTYELTLDDLLTWANDFVKPRAAMALKGEGGATEGPWCKYCKAKAICPLKNQNAQEVLSKSADISAEALKDGRVSDEELAELLPKLDAIEDWVASIKEYALAKAVEGTVWPGMELGTSRSTRVYTDEQKVIEKVKELGIEDKAYGLLTVAKLEKALGKKTFTTAFGDLVTTKPGNPTLVKKD